jgi:hypothetical protein
VCAKIFPKRKLSVSTATAAAPTSFVTLLGHFCGYLRRTRALCKKVLMMAACMRISSSPCVGLAVSGFIYKVGREPVSRRRKKITRWLVMVTTEADEEVK